MIFRSVYKTRFPMPGEALRGNEDSVLKDDVKHYVNGRPLKGPYPQKTEKALFGLGCFWGAERAFWSLPGVWTTAVGYAGGFTPNPTYEDVCTGKTGHNEVVLVVYSPEEITYMSLLKVFWEAHDPTQGFRQGNDVGTQYRSGIYTFSDEQTDMAEISMKTFQASLILAGFEEITTEVYSAPDFYFAEESHQQYLAKNPDGYCGLGGIGVPLSI